jgi:hypothetical protein
MHTRLFGHPSHDVTKRIEKKLSIPHTEYEPNCEECNIGKAASIKFNKGKRLEETINFQTISFDLTGPMEITGIQSSERFLLVMVHHESDITSVVPPLRRKESKPNISNLSSNDVKTTIDQSAQSNATIAEKTYQMTC